MKQNMKQNLALSSCRAASHQPPAPTKRCRRCRPGVFPPFISALLLAIAALAFTTPSSRAATSRFWSGTGTWNISTANWGTVTGGPYNTFTWVNGNNDTGVFEGTAGTVSLGAAITVGGLEFDTASYIITANTLTFGGSGNILANQNATINSAIALASGTITKTGSGTLTLGGNNTYAASTTVSVGTLKAGSTTALSANSPLSVAASATLDLGGFNNTIKSLGVDTATSTITDSSAVGSGGTLTVSTALGAACAQLFTGSMGIKIFGGGNSTILGNANSTYSGGTIFGNGGTSGTRFLGNGTIGTGSPGAVTKGYFGTGTITIGAATTDRSQFYFSGNSTINNALVVNTALGDSSSLGTFRLEPGPVTIAGTINANLSDVMFQTQNGGGRTATVTGAISGNSGLQVYAQGASGGITVTLNNTGTANSYAGNTSIDSANATLTLGAANQIPNGTGKGNLIITNGTFNMAGYSETINGLSGSGTVDGVSGTPTLTVGDNNATSTYSGVIKNTAGTLALTKTGAGTLTLNNVNTYSGATTINAGKLQGVVGGSCANSTVILNAATATNSVSITDNTKSWTCANLTVSAAGVLEFNFGAVTPSATLSPLNIIGLADFTLATPTVSVLVNSGVAPGTYPLMTWGSTSGTAPTTANLTSTLPYGVAASLSVSGNTLNLVIVSTADYWDNNGATTGFGAAAGTWASPTTGDATQGWSTDGTGSTLPTDLTTTATNGVSFGNGATGLGAGTITVSGSVTNGAMTFDSGSGAITLFGGTIYFPATGLITVNNSSNNINSVLAGASTSLTKAGTGTLTLSGNNTYTGATMVNAGTLNLTGQGTNASITVNSGGVFNEGASVVITGSGVTFTQNSSGNTSTLAGTNTYTGATTVSAGTLKAGSTTALSTNSAVSVAAGATLDLGGFNNSIKSLSTATGTITDSSAAGSGGTLKITTMAATAQLFTGSLGLQWNANQINSTILTSSANTYSGGTTVGGSAGFNNRFFLGSTTIGSGTPGALTSGVWGTGAVTLGTATNEWSQILFTGAATINNALVVNSALGNSDAAGTFRVDSTGNVLAGTLTANLANATFRNNGGTGAIRLNGAISGASGLILSASGGTSLTITLANAGTANSYAGNTTISSVKETLTLAAADQIPNGAGKGNLINNGTFNMGGFSETINGLSGSGTVDGGTGTPTLTVGDGDANGTFSGVIKNTAGTLTLTKIGAGTLALSGVSTYSGATTINAGRLQGVVGGSCANSTVNLNAPTATSSVSITDNTKGWTNAALTVGAAGILEFNFGTVTPSTTVSPLKITGLADFTAATPTVSVIVNSSSLAAGTYPLMTWGSTSGTVPTTANLVATLPLGSGGSLSVSGNTLNLVIVSTVDYWDNNGATAGFGTAAGTWASPTTGDATQGWSTDGTGSTLPADFTTAATNAVSFGNGATGLGEGTITVSGSVTNGSMTFASDSGAITLSGGAIYFPAAGAITVNNSSDIIDSVLAGASTSLTKGGIGTLTLSGANTYTGSTTVSAGTLDVQNAHAFGASSRVSISNNAVLSIEGGITITNPITFAGDGIIQPDPLPFGVLLSSGNNTLSGRVTVSAARLTTADNNTMTFTGGITNGTAGGTTLVGDFTIANNPINVGNNSINLAGDGASVPPVTGKTIRLNVGGNNWSSALVFFAGIVQLGVDNAMPVGAPLQFGGGTVDNARSTLDLNGHNQTVATIETLTTMPVDAGTNVSITGGGTLTVNQSVAKGFNGIISDGATPTALTKTGTGTLTLSNACTYSGVTTVSNGVLQLTRPNGLSTNTSVHLFTASGNLNLAFTGTNQVAALYINGVAQPAGVYGNTTAPITGAGFLQVRAPVAPGSFSGISVSGTTLTLIATNGTPNGPWTLLSSTNVALPLTQWGTNSTGTYDGSGNLNMTLLNTATNPADFFILK